MLQDYRKKRLFRKIGRLLARVLELDELLRKDATFDEERIAKINEQIRAHQKKLDAIYDELEQRKGED